MIRRTSPTLSPACAVVALTAILSTLVRTTHSFQPSRVVRYEPLLRRRPSSSSSSSLFQSTQERQQESETMSSSSSSSSSSTTTWKPTISSLSERKSYFQSQKDNAAETLGTVGFHHVEFYTGDALMTAKRFELALGVPITCVSSLATGNDVCVTYGLECGVADDGANSGPGEGVRFLITAPLSRAMQQQQQRGAIDADAGDDDANNGNNSSSSNNNNNNNNVQMTAPLPLPGYDVDAAHEFYSKHGLAVRAVGIEVEDATEAYEAAVSNGAVGVSEPTIVPSFAEGAKDGHGGGCAMAEVELYGDVVLRFVSFGDGGDESAPRGGDESNDQPSPFLPHLAPYPSYKKTRATYGLTRIDHTVGNVPNLLATQQYIQKFTGYHPFAEFTPEDIGTVDSGLNSIVLASDSEAVLLPLNEPTQGKRKSQIQTYLEQNEGPGLQHIAIKTNDIFSTISKMRHAEEEYGGFELMVRPSSGYYEELPSRLGDKLTDEQYAQLGELGILADADEEGVLLQIFTKPLGDRPTLFLEIIQRIGCPIEEEEGAELGDSEGSVGKASSAKLRERPGCGGFGQGNFRELFKAIEDHEKTLKV